MTGPAKAIRARAQEATRLRGECRDEASDSGTGPEKGIRDLTHDGLALDLGDQWHGKAKHVASWGRWLFWNGSVWKEDETLQHMTRTRQFLRARAENLREHSKGTKTEKRLRSAHTVATVVNLARSNEAQAATVEQWDADPYQLGHPTPEDA